MLDKIKNSEASVDSMSYRFLNELGPTELTNRDAASFVTRDSRGGVQALLWNFTTTQPGTENDQAFHKEDHPAQAKGKIALRIAHLSAGRYTVRRTRLPQPAHPPDRGLTNR